MAFTLRYGCGSALELSVPTDAVVAQRNVPAGKPLLDVEAALGAALEAPLDFPPLSRATVPGDRIAIVLDDALPRRAELVNAVLAYLVECGADVEQIRVVASAGDAMQPGGASGRSWEDDLVMNVQTSYHDPRDANHLCYLGLSTAQRPIYINRDIFDADLVLPIGCLRSAGSPAFMGIHGGWFPAFSDQETIARFRTPRCLTSVEQLKHRREEIDEVAWLLGIVFSIQVVPGAEGNVLHVLAGETNSVARVGQQLCEQAWHFDVPHRAPLVIATLDGGTGQQTWNNVARALAATANLVDDGGAVALCTDLCEMPGKSLRRLSNNGMPGDVLSKLRGDKGRDAWSALEVARALDRGPVYLLSRLADDEVEQLGLTPVHSAAELDRLAQRYARCILIGQAQHAVPTVGAEVDDRASA